MKVVFLDRDGVINHLGRGYLTKPDEMFLLPGSARAIKILNDLGIPVIVVTNQSIIGRGMADARILRKLHGKIDDLLYEETGAMIDWYLYATGTDSNDSNRKPNIGMFEQAKVIYPGINISSSWVVGDNKTDIEFGQRVGLNTILVKSGHGMKYINECSPNYVVDGLIEAIKIIEKA
jgi:D-glycero-D-manno-heptose 1,7-bisphosphate phosphatase